MSFLLTGVTGHLVDPHDVRMTPRQMCEQLGLSVNGGLFSRDMFAPATKTVSEHPSQCYPHLHVVDQAFVPIRRVIEWITEELGAVPFTAPQLLQLVSDIPLLMLAFEVMVAGGDMYADPATRQQGYANIWRSGPKQGGAGEQRGFGIFNEHQEVMAGTAFFYSMSK